MLHAPRWGRQVLRAHRAILEGGVIGWAPAPEERGEVLVDARPRELLVNAEKLAGLVDLQEPPGSIFFDREVEASKNDARRGHKASEQGAGEMQSHSGAAPPGADPKPIANATVIMTTESAANAAP